MKLFNFIRTMIGHGIIFTLKILGLFILLFTMIVLGHLFVGLFV